MEYWNTNKEIVCEVCGAVNPEGGLWKMNRGPAYRWECARCVETYSNNPSVAVISDWQDVDVPPVSYSSLEDALFRVWNLIDGEENASLPEIVATIGGKVFNRIASKESACPECDGAWEFCAMGHYKGHYKNKGMGTGYNVGGLFTRGEPE